MNLGGGSNPAQTIQTTTNNSSPWSGVQPYLSDLYSTADAMQRAGTGGNVFQGQRVADINPTMQTGMDQLGNQLQGLYSSNDLSGAKNLAQNVINSQGLTPTDTNVMGSLENLASEQMREPLNIYHQVLGAAPEQADVYRNVINNSPEQVQNYRNIINQANQRDNPYLQAILDQNARQIGDRVNSSMSGSGRYGSGAHTDLLARAINETNAPILAQDYEARQGRAMAANQGLGSVFGQQAQMAQGLGNVAGQVGQVGNSIGNLIGQRAGMYGAEADLSNQGLSRAGQFASMIPQLDQASLAPAQSLLNLGDYQRGLQQEDLNSQIQKFNEEQGSPWLQLQRMGGILAGAGTLGGQNTSTVSQPQPTAARSILGGTLAGAGIGSAFGPLGTGVGALGGGLLGLLGR